MDDYQFTPVLEQLYEQMKPMRVYNGSITLPKGEPNGHGNVIFTLNPNPEETVVMLANDSLKINSSYRWYSIDLIYRGKIYNKRLHENLTSTIKEMYKEKRENQRIAFATPSHKRELVDSNTNFIQDLSQWMKYYFSYRRVLKRDQACSDFMRLLATYIESPDYDSYNKVIFINMDAWETNEKGVYGFNKVDDLTNPLSLFLCAAKYNEEMLTNYASYTLYVVSLQLKQSVVIPMQIFTKKNITKLRSLLSKFKVVDTQEESIEDNSSDVMNEDMKIAKRQQLIKSVVNHFVGPVEDVTDFREIDEEDNEAEIINEIENDEFADEIEAETNKFIEQHKEILTEDEDVAQAAIKDYISKYMMKRVKPEKDDDYKTLIEKMQKDHDIALKKNPKRDIRSKMIETTDMSSYIQTLNPNITKSTYVNFDKGYVEKKLEEHIDSTIDALTKAEYPLFVTEKTVEDTSDSLNLKKTYTYHLEDTSGKKHTIKVDIPTIIDNNYIWISGAKKIIGHQLVLKPLVKVSPSTVIMSTWFNKTFIYRQSNDTINSSKLLKFFFMNEKKFSTKIGNSTRKNTEYVTSLDFGGISKKIYSFTVGTHKFITDLPAMREYCEKQGIKLKPVDPLNPVIAYDTAKKEAVYLPKGMEYADFIISLLSEHDRKAIIDMKIGKRNNFVNAKINGKFVPIIVFLLFCEGFTSIMKKANIEYKIIKDKKELKDYPSHEWGVTKLSDACIVWKRYPFENSLLMNGLQGINMEIFSSEELDDQNTYNLIISNIYGNNNASYLLAQTRDFMIDDCTREMLEDEGLPTDLSELFIYATKMLKSNDFLPENHLSNIRVRSNEMIPALLYSAVTKKGYMKYRQTAYKKKKSTPVSIPQNAVIMAMLSEDANACKLIEEASALNPVLTIEKARAVTYKGPGGINMDRSLSIKMRGYDESMLGTLAMVTPNDGNVGVVRQLTLEPNITSTLGYIDVKGKKGLDKMSSVNLCSPAELLTPLSYQHDDPTRTAMTYKQSKYMVLVHDSDPVLIGNKVESLIPYHSPEDFSVMAKQDGEVVEKTDDYIVIKYKDGTFKTVDLTPQVKKNAAAGFWIVIEFETNLKQGDKVKEGQAIAWDPKAYAKNRGDRGLSMKLGVFTKVAVAPNWDIFEDSCPITYSLSQRLKTDMIDEKKITLSKSAFVDWMVKVGDKVKTGDPLLRFDESRDNDDFMMEFLKNARKSMKEKIIESTMSTIKAKHTGEVIDIKVYSTVPEEQLDPSLQTILKEYHKKVKKKKAVLEKYENPGDSAFYKSGTLIGEDDAVLKTDAQGKIKGKKVDEGVMICIYVKYTDAARKGDKVCAEFALKGIVSHVIPQGYECFSSYRPEEKVDYLVAPLSITARKVPSIFLAMFGNKLIVEIKRQHVEMWKGSGDVATKKKKIVSHLVKFLELLDPTKDNANYYKEFFGKMSDKAFKTYFDEFVADPKFNYYVEIIEFERDIKMENIEKAANFINVPLFEDLALPYITMDKENPVVAPIPTPVGYINLKRMQQTLLGKNHASIDIDKRNPYSGQVIGEDKNARNSDVETYAMIAMGAKYGLKELLGFRADDMTAKNEAYNLISQNGYLDLNDLTDDPANRIALKTLDVYFMMQGIYTNIMDSNRTPDDNMKVHLYTDKILTKDMALQQVSNQLMFERDNIPVPDGLFSEEIFGTTTKERNSNCGYIDLKCKVFHPFVFEILQKVLPKAKKIIAGQGSFVVENGDVVEIKNREDSRYNELNTGIEWLVKNYKKINLKKNASIVRSQHIDMLNALTDDEIFISKWIVIPVFYRGIDKSSGKMAVHELNDKYRNLIRYANHIDPSELPLANNQAMCAIQTTLLDIRKYGQELIAHKDGAFHKIVLGKSNDYGMRAVISVPTFIYADKPSDMQVDVLHSGIPLSLLLSGGYPFMSRSVLNFFDNLFKNVKEVPCIEKGEDGKNKVIYIKTKDQTNYFTKEYIDKKMKEFMNTFANRFEPIKIRLENGKEVPIRFTGRPYGTAPNNPNVPAIAERPLTWTDVFYICAMECMTDKHAYITRYPLVDYFGEFPTRVIPVSTVHTVPMEVDGVKYKHYPVIDPSLDEDEISTLFIDTIMMSNLFLDGIGGDYDGDTVSAKVVYSIQANQEAEDYLKKIKQYIRIDGSNVRVISNEPYLTFFNMTKKAS